MPARGRLITTELSAAKAGTAAVNLAQAGLDDVVELRVGDALDTLAGLDDDVDFLFLDGSNDLYRGVLELVAPRLAPGALVVADLSAGDPELERYRRADARPRLGLRVRRGAARRRRGDLDPRRLGDRRERLLDRILAAVQIEDLADRRMLAEHGREHRRDILRGTFPRNGSVEMLTRPVPGSSVSAPGLTIVHSRSSRARRRPPRPSRAGTR